MKKSGDGGNSDNFGVCQNPIGLPGGWEFTLTSALWS